ncbi:hypothetical protein TNCV_1437421 [Trichonephila clavipes]|nr:hypothetical protein TNCV_1437421 [Trichonephila clavipes]
MSACNNKLLNVPIFPEKGKIVTEKICQESGPGMVAMTLGLKPSGFGFESRDSLCGTSIRHCYQHSLLVIMRSGVLRQQFFLSRNQDWVRIANSFKRHTEVTRSNNRNKSKPVLSIDIMFSLGEVFIGCTKVAHDVYLC